VVPRGSGPCRWRGYVFFFILPKAFRAPSICRFFSRRSSSISELVSIKEPEGVGGLCAGEGGRFDLEDFADFIAVAFL